VALRRWWGTPLRTWWAVNRSRLVGLRVNILWEWSRILVRHAVGRLATLKELQARLDMYICRIQVSGSLVRVQSVGGLVVARFILGHNQHSVTHDMASG
jgi:hypothetical protein